MATCCQGHCRVRLAACTASSPCLINFLAFRPLSFHLGVFHETHKKKKKKGSWRSTSFQDHFLLPSGTLRAFLSCKHFDFLSIFQFGPPFLCNDHKPTTKPFLIQLIPKKKKKVTSTTTNSLVPFPLI